MGNARCQSIWYSGVAGSPDTHSRVFTCGGEDWNQLAEQVTQWLNDFVAPHQLISVSIYETEHPNNSRTVNAIVTHRAGERPVRLATSAAGRNLPSSGVYTMDVVRAEDSQGAVMKALSVINRKGGQEGHVCGTANDSVQQDIVAIVISWAALLEAQIEEDLRPTGCAGCSIF